MKFAIPFFAFLFLLGFLAAGLQHDPHEVPSPLIGKPAPIIRLERLDNPVQSFSSESLLGQVWLLNAWASWCESCRDEHGLLVELASTGGVRIYGLNYKDQHQSAINFLQNLGNPFVLSVEDSDGRVGIDFGLYGVPETYVIDRQGMIRLKHIGPITRESWQGKILPTISRLIQ